MGIKLSSKKEESEKKAETKEESERNPEIDGCIERRRGGKGDQEVDGFQEKREIITKKLEKRNNLFT